MTKLTFRVSNDGKHIAGRSIPVEPDDTNLDDEFVSITTAEPNEFQTALENEILANAASRMADEHASNAKLARGNATKVECAIRRNERDMNKLNKQIAHIEALMPTCVKALGLTGFSLGAILGASEVLYFHGPTVTTPGTLLAAALFIAVGTGFGWFFAWILRQHFDDRRAECKDQLDRCKIAIKRLTAEKQAQLEKADEYDKLSADERKRSYEHRGFIDRKN